MLADVITGTFAELLGSLASVLVLTLITRTRRRRAERHGVGPAEAEPQARPARTYTLIGTRAPDGHTMQLASSRPAGTVITRRVPGGRQQRFELTDAILSDGTYAADPLDGYW
ncbi:hypothetical protein [Streptomyces vinaceus]|uniref:hypothetical protein n=1 Tax=Streptomyces vinaceus TaxID=1960 RepID=UPI0036C815D6